MFSDWFALGCRMSDWKNTMCILVYRSYWYVFSGCLIHQNQNLNLFKRLCLFTGNLKNWMTLGFTVHTSKPSTLLTSLQLKLSHVLKNTELEPVQRLSLLMTDTHHRTLYNWILCLWWWAKSYTCYFRLVAYSNDV